MDRGILRGGCCIRLLLSIGKQKPINLNSIKFYTRLVDLVLGSFLRTVNLFDRILIHKINPCTLYA